MKYGDYGEHQLAAFAYQLNRRFDLLGIVARVIVDVVRMKQINAQHVNAHAEASFWSSLYLLGLDEFRRADSINPAAIVGIWTSNEDLYEAAQK